MKARQLFLVSVACLIPLVAAAQTAPAAVVADAARRGNVEQVRALLEHGADVNAAQADGMTALHWAAETSNAALAEMLLYAGANVSAVTRIGQYTPLHLAAKAGSAPSSSRTITIL